MRRLAFVALAGCFSKPIIGTDDHLDTPVTLAAGSKHACRIDGDARLWCWGNNDRGQLAQPLTLTATGTPQPVSDETGWTWIAAGDEHTCGIRDTRLFCWGFGAPAIEELTLREPPRAVFAGGTQTCAITISDELYCWSGTNMPARVEPAGIRSAWRSVAIASDHTCALRDGEHATYCWGENDQGQLGGGEAADVAPENAIKRDDDDYVAIGAGLDVTCAITIGRALACWGSAERTGPREEEATASLDFTRRWTALAVGSRHVCAVGDLGVYCTGDDDRGALGPEDAPDAAVIAATRVVAGDGFSCSQDGGDVACWGTNELGELGNHEIATQRQPTALGHTAARIALGPTTSCAIDGSQQLTCWGDNRAGQIVPDGEPRITRPLAVGTFLDVAPGASHTCAITTDAKAIECWGANDAAQLGSSDVDTHRARIEATSFQNTTTFVAIAAGASTTCAVTDRNEVACWGTLPGGESQQAPTLLNGTYDSVAVGNGFAIVAAPASPRDTSVVGSIADCIDATMFPATQPIIAGQTSSPLVVLAAQAQASHVCVLEAARLICGGVNATGQTGQSNTMMCRPPATVAAPAGKTWGASVVVGGDHSCALDSDGRLYCWGGNHHGELAAIDSGKTTPQLLDATTWSAIATSTFHSCGLDASGAVYCWGENRYGELGIGSSYLSTPTAVLP